MRLWSIHPSYFDSRGLVALWREALLAQRVLQGRTRGYRFHPQLDRFRGCSDPRAAIAAYLRNVWDEANSRGYNFNLQKIAKRRFGGRIAVTRGQLNYEFGWLRRKLKTRDPARWKASGGAATVRAHPLFLVKIGGIETWEKGKRPKQ